MEFNNAWLPLGNCIFHRFSSILCNSGLNLYHVSVYRLELYYIKYISARLSSGMVWYYLKMELFSWFFSLKLKEITLITNTSNFVLWITQKLVLLCLSSYICLSNADNIIYHGSSWMPISSWIGCQQLLPEIYSCDWKPYMIIW